MFIGMDWSHEDSGTICAVWFGMLPGSGESDIAACPQNCLPFSLLPPCPGLLLALRIRPLNSLLPSLIYFSNWPPQLLAPASRLEVSSLVLADGKDF